MEQRREIGNENMGLRRRIYGSENRLVNGARMEQRVGGQAGEGGSKKSAL